MIDVSESQLPDNELADFLQRMHEEEAREAVCARERLQRIYSFRFCGGML